MPDHDLERNTRLVVGHFEDFVNRKDLDAIDRNLSNDFVDHDGPGGRTVDRWATVTPMHEVTAKNLNW